MGFGASEFATPEQKSKFTDPYGITLAPMPLTSSTEETGDSLVGMQDIFGTLGQENLFLDPYGKIASGEAGDLNRLLQILKGIG
jgi:hypothetical protein